MMTVDTKRLRELAENIIGTEFESEDFNSTLLVNHVDYNGEQHFGFEMKKSIRDFISQANPQAIIALIDELECAVRAAPAQSAAEFKSTPCLKVATPVPSVFFAGSLLSV